MAVSRLCSIPECGKNALRRELCAGHLARLAKYGDPTAGGTPKGAARAFVLQAISYEGEECLIWPYYRGVEGYGTITIDGETHRPHRLVCIAVNGPPPTTKHESAHTCGNGRFGCVAGSHLVWKTRQENQDDRVGHGTYIFGERIGTSKLTEQAVREIRSTKGKEEQRDVALRYGVSQALISVICSGKRWAHVE